MSIYFKNLEDNIKGIVKGLGLKKYINKLDNNTDLNEMQKIIDKTQVLGMSFIILIHTYLEKYFEVLAYAIVDKSYITFKDTNKINYPLISIAAKYSNIDEKQNAKNSHNTNSFGDNTIEILKKTIDIYKHDLYRNNGIKNKDISKMFSPLGFDENDFKSIIDALDSIGSKRGQLVHTGCLKDTINIKKVYDDTNDLLKQIKEFDKVIFEKRYITNSLLETKIEDILYFKIGVSEENK